MSAAKMAEIEDDVAEELDPSEAEDDGSDDEEDETESSSEDDSDSSFDESTVVRPKETLLQGRQKRSTAGRRMAAMLDDEEDNENLFTQKFGDDVFDDANSDYEAKDEESWDELDTDFDDAEEDDTMPADDEDEELKKKRRVYTDPLKPAKKRRQSKSDGPRYARGPRAPKEPVSYDHLPSRKSSRKATVEQNKERESRQKAKNMKRPAKKSPIPVVRMTQAERLREAVHTERENKLSLLKFLQKEEAKKKTAIKNTTYKGPVIRYHSKTVLDANGTKEAKNFIMFCNADDSFMRSYFPVKMGTVLSTKDSSNTSTSPS